MTDAPEPVDPDVVTDLRRRLRKRRPTPVADALPGSAGVDLDLLDELLDYWADGYDWAATEQRVRALPWRLVPTSLGPLRAVVRPAGPDAPVAVLVHGWPDSVLRFERVLPLLTDITVVIPALPGYPFAAPVDGHGRTAAETATMIAEAMTALGYNEFVVSAGDVGCDVAETIAAEHPHLVTALHLTDISQYHYLTAMPEDANPEERAYEEHGHRWQFTEGGYMHLQRTKPRTPAVALNDSPAGLAAWLLEKLTSWTDNDGDVYQVFSRDDLLDWISGYWMSACIGTSFTPYAMSRIPDKAPPAPAVFTIYAYDLVNAPRAFAARIFNVQAWHEYSRGGHFAAWEQAASYADAVREAVALGRRR